MRWFASRKREQDDWIEAVRPELRDIAVPIPSEEVLARILASHAAGARIILPDGRPIVDRSPTRPVVALFVAVVLLLLLPVARATLFRARGGDVALSGGAPASEWLAGSVAFAQTEPGVPRAAMPPLRLARPDRLQPVALEYERTWHDSTGRMVGRALGVVTLQADSIAGTPAWRFVSRNSGERDGHPLLTVDSVYFSRSDLRLMRRVAIQAPYSRYDEIRIVQRYSGDSVLGRMNVKGTDATPEGRPIARRLPPSDIPYITDVVAPVLLSSVDLRAGWWGAASMVGWAVIDRDVVLPVSLHVDAAETVTVPAGTFDCWRLTVRYARHTLFYWVRKSDGIGVKSLQTEANRVVRDVVLTRAGS